MSDFIIIDDWKERSGPAWAVGQLLFQKGHYDMASFGASGKWNLPVCPDRTSSFGIVLVEVDPELLGQNAINVTGAVKNAADVDPLGSRQVEDQILFEATHREKADVAEGRILRLVTAAHARHSS
jgi:hypothetical protein